MPIPQLYEKLPVDPSPVQNLLTQGIVYELTALAAKEGLFTALAVRKTAAGLARELAWDETITERVLQVLAQAGYLTCVGGAYTAVPAMAKYLHRNSPWFLADSLLSEFPAGSFAHRVLAALNNETVTPCCHKKAQNQPERLRGIGARAVTGEFVQTTVQAVSLDRKKHLLDLGGGHGFYSIAFAQKYPGLTVTLFDVPDIAALAAAAIANYGLSGRVQTRAGDFLATDIGSGYDAVLCSLMLSPSTLATVLPKVYSAVLPGGTLIVRTHIKDGFPSLAGSINRLFCTLNGQRTMYTLTEWQTWLAEYGFSNIQTANITDIVAVLTATRP
ncbi:methyltransferase [Sporomusa termitida]|uniref:3-hydroxy-5-methyl-1-naphthoate 3-O-methyltransferase n=1 Tax=Sporomusa termitida TaxID=2377 RepID=A0A517DRG6_9FIRM|nr:methyltransferase [Sporomusa termitida]QDR79876.1 3-hydroxy-5-methyl-1-naphthoate 3-O-methyltransferase [Sporomusa termitida]